MDITHLSLDSVFIKTRDAAVFVVEMYLIWYLWSKCIQRSHRSSLAWSFVSCVLKLKRFTDDSIDRRVMYITILNDVVPHSMRWWYTMVSFLVVGRYSTRYSIIYVLTNLLLSLSKSNWFLFLFPTYSTWSWSYDIARTLHTKQSVLPRTGITTHTRELKTWGMEASFRPFWV